MPNPLHRSLRPTLGLAALLTLLHTPGIRAEPSPTPLVPGQALGLDSRLADDRQDEQDEQDEQDDGPSEEQIEAAVTALDAALEARAPAKLLEACSAAASVPHGEVTERLADVLRVRVPDEAHRDVRRAAIAALGAQALEPSLEALHRYYAKGEFAKQDELQKDAEFATSLLRAIASHEHASSIEHLTDDVFATPGVEPLRARILGLARIRTNESLEAVLELMGRSARGRRGAVRQMQDFRLALTVLGGQDHGVEPTAWRRWWNDVRRDFEVAEEPIPLPDALGRRWRRYWGFEEEGRGTRREDRGGGQPRR